MSQKKAQQNVEINTLAKEQRELDRLIREAQNGSVAVNMGKVFPVGGEGGQGGITQEEADALKAKVADLEKSAAETEKASADAVAKAEAAKDEVIKEKDAEIADLKAQLEAATAKKAAK